MAGLYQQLCDRCTQLEQRRYNKSSMVAVSHALEDAVLEFELQADMFVFFQKEKFFRVEADRYRELAEICSSLHLFADQFSPQVRRGFGGNTHFYEIDSFSREQREKLIQEWAVIVHHEENPMALLTEELPGKQIIPRDEFRVFRGNLFFDEAAVKSSVEILSDLLCREERCPDSLLEKVNNLRGGDGKGDDAGPVQDRSLVAPFLNNALQEIEEGVNRLAGQNMMLNYSLAENERRTREIIKRLCFAAEYRDDDTAEHLLRIGLLSTLLYSRVREDENKLESMFYGALMHDIGKIGIPDSILFKEGSLTEEEYEVIKQHPEIAVNILRDSDHELLEMARTIAHTHHERFDGGGYPRGLAGEDIPLEGRIVAIADVFDALVSERVYKEAFSLERALDIMEEERNSHFDGRLLDIFFDHLDEILSILRSLNDEFSRCEEADPAAKYFQLSPDFSSLSGENLPAYEELFPAGDEAEPGGRYELFGQRYPADLLYL